MTDHKQRHPWRTRFRSGEETKRIRAWYRRVACPKCDALAGRACRTAAGYPTDSHRARSDAAGSPPYRKWQEEGLFQPPGPAESPAILVDCQTMRADFNVDQPLGDAAAIVSHVLTHRLGISLGDEPTLDQLDEAARALTFSRGPIGSADLVTVLATQVANLAGIIAGPFGDPEAMYTAMIRDQVAQARRLQEEKSITE
ncbi:zinc finger domain-containing protein [Streptomyces arboris]|uniref:zinc finger domain-containing protein n=1 Tax=Streptomyces arboris TaxID=2600619 RepID=UPI003BF53993